MTPKRDIISWQSMADPVIVEVIGNNLKQMRLNKNLTQIQLANLSGLGRATISCMESGRAATTLTIVQVLRALGKFDILNAFNEDAILSPLQMLRMKKRQRRRASSPRKSSRKKVDGE